jgi:hypothetical protein
MAQSVRTLAGIHASYFVVTGLWPLLSRGTFERVTGPKEDFWLVRTIGGLAAATGVALGIGVIRGKREHESVVLAIGASLVFTIADVRAARTESRVYLADAAVQAILAPAWLGQWTK